MHDDDDTNEEPGEDGGGTAEVLPGYDEPSDDELSAETKEHIAEESEPIEPTDE